MGSACVAERGNNGVGIERIELLDTFSETIDRFSMRSMLTPLLPCSATHALPVRIIKAGIDNPRRYDLLIVI